MSVFLNGVDQNSGSIVGASDYETGTWTGILMDDSLDAGGESQSTSVNNGRYMKVGDIVYISISLLFTSLGTLTAGQTAALGGLPFTSNASTGNADCVTFGPAAGLAITALSSPAAFVFANATRFGLRNFDVSTGTSGLLISEISADGAFTLNGWYAI